jgi:hypothetical protein
MTNTRAFGWFRKLDRTDSIGFIAAVVAAGATILGYVLVETEAEWCICLRTIVAFGVGFWSAMFLHLVAEVVKDPGGALGRMVSITGPKLCDRCFGVFFMLLGLGLGVLMVRLPIVNSQPAPIGTALLLASVLFGEFTLPSYRRPLPATERVSG